MKYKEFLNPEIRFNKNYIKIAKEEKEPCAKNDDFKKKIKINSDHHSRCRYINPETNKRCKNFLGKYPKFCYSHTMLIENLYLDESQILNGGIGLFSGPYGIEKDQIIGKYSNYTNHLSYKLHDKRCSKDKNCFEYIFCHKNKCWDASDIRSTITRYINDAINTNFKNNCRFQIIDNNVYIIASRNIKPFKELFVSYGTNFWN